MTLLLAGDIGGTKTILRLVEVANTEENQQTLHQDTYPSQNFPDLVPIVEKFLSAAGKNETPKGACFAIAGPVVNNTAKLTNLTWSLDAKHLEDQLGIPCVNLINDFAAIGYGILGLKTSDIESLQAGEWQSEAPIAVIGAGTGLGQGFLIKPSSQPHQVFPSEGGHADFAPRNEIEFQLLKYLLDKYNVDRISVERVVSGQGIVAIYQFLRDCQKLPETPKVRDVIRKWEQEIGGEKTVDPAATIAMAATEKRDNLSERTMQIFLEAYGAEAGNLALKLLPYGGLYIAGGIAAKNISLIKQGSFTNAFKNKGRMGSLLEKIPVRVILNQEVGLIGAAISAARQAANLGE